jgi:hypothetical protein
VLALQQRLRKTIRELELVRKGELCPHEMPLQRVASAVSKEGELLSAHAVADRTLKRIAELEQAMEKIALENVSNPYAFARSILGEKHGH